MPLVRCITRILEAAVLPALPTAIGVSGEMPNPCIYNFDAAIAAHIVRTQMVKGIWSKDGVEARAPCQICKLAVAFHVMRPRSIAFEDAAAQIKPDAAARRDQKPQTRQHILWEVVCDNGDSNTRSSAGCSKGHGFGS